MALTAVSRSCALCDFDPQMRQTVAQLNNEKAAAEANVQSANNRLTSLETRWYVRLATFTTPASHCRQTGRLTF